MRTAGIDARTDQIGEMEGADRLANARNLRQCGNPFILLLAGHLQALDHESTVDTGERHHVANGGQCNEIKQRKQIRRRDIAQAPQDFCGLHQGKEHDTGGTQMALA